ncbi:MAG: dihydroneopterin aldolase [Chloroflexi bacterium]|nr:dihydroneopterin aldolase [Chloroflexota bacterium]
MSQDKIILSGMVFYGFHGANSEEKELGQRFIVDLEIEYDLRAAGESDNLTDTVNYSRFYHAVKEVVEGPSLNLLEAVAERIVSNILQRYPVESAMVRLKKPEVPIKGSILDYAAVQIYRRREEAS